MTTAWLLILATLLPLAGFVLLIFLGRRLGAPLAGWVATAFIAAAFACSLAGQILWLSTASAPADEVVRSTAGADPVRLPQLIPVRWLPVGAGAAQDHGGFLDVGVYVDSLTVAMFLMVTVIASLIFVFSLGYMEKDPRFPRFYAYLCFFCFSMLGLVIAGTLLQVFIFWELVGVSSYLLIGFWYEKKSASNAAIKAFVVNRIGDLGFLVGMGVLFFCLGNLTLPQAWTALDASRMDPARGIEAGGLWMSPTLLTVMGIGLFFGAVGKSAQFPLHVWLPDAMEGPTPVSALIHAATMVAAGVYLVARIFPILTPEARLFIAIIGLTTLTMAALIACAQMDIKRVLAYSTLSQLGYMIMALGVGSWVGGLFHLITHAFFKALLFLGAGSVIHAAHHRQELTDYGGLIRRIPITGITFAVAVLAIAGTPFLSGYYSKDLILAHAGAFAAFGAEHASSLYGAFFLLPAAVAVLTAFYMTRVWTLTFLGGPRNPEVFAHAHERPVMYVPLIVLALFSIVAGRQIGAREMIEASVEEATLLCRRTDPAFSGFAAAWTSIEPAAAEAGRAQSMLAGVADPAQERALEEGWHLVHTYVTWAFAVGIGLGLLIYMRGFAVASAMLRFPPLRWLHVWLVRKMYFDELYNILVVGVAVGASRLLGLWDRVVVDGLVNLMATITRRTSHAAGLHDRYVVDGAVGALADATVELGEAVRNPASGRIRIYVAVALGCVVVGVAGTIAVVLAT